MTRSNRSRTSSTTMLSNDSRRNSLFSFSDSVSSLSTNDQQSLGTCGSFQDEDTMSVATMSYGSHHYDERIAPAATSTVSGAAIASAIATIKSVINRIKYHYNENFHDDTIINKLSSTKMSNVIGMSTETIVSFISGFILCIMFDVTLYRMKRHTTTTNSSIELLFHNQYSFINIYIIIYTFLSYLYRKTIYKLQKYIIRESTTIYTGDSIYNLLLSLPDIFNLGLACFISTRQIYYAFHLLAVSVVILSLFIALCDYYIYRINILTSNNHHQDETIEYTNTSSSPKSSRHHHQHHHENNIIIDMRPTTTSSMVTRELKTRKKAKRTVRSNSEKIDESKNSFWFSMV